MHTGGRGLGGEEDALVDAERVRDILGGRGVQHILGEPPAAPALSPSRRARDPLRAALAHRDGCRLLDCALRRAEALLDAAGALLVLVREGVEDGYDARDALSAASVGAEAVATLQRAARAATAAAFDDAADAAVQELYGSALHCCGRALYFVGTALFQLGAFRDSLGAFEVALHWLWRSHAYCSRDGPGGHLQLNMSPHLVIEGSEWRRSWASERGLVAKVLLRSASASSAIGAIMYTENELHHFPETPCQITYYSDGIVRLTETGLSRCIGAIAEKEHLAVLFQNGTPSADK